MVSASYLNNLTKLFDGDSKDCYICRLDAGWSSLAARRAHNPKVVGSNPAPATKFFCSST